MNRSVIEHAQAGGALFGGGEISPVLKGIGGLNEEDARELHNLLDQDHTRSYGLSEYVESAAIFYKHTYIARRHVVKYIANKLGGAHLDVSRTRKEDGPYVLLDDLQARAHLMGKPAAYYELLSIGQAIASSADAKVFITRVES
ncbi:MAG: hypothetical protein WD249_04250 [Gaiellaceae bacterium]